MRPEEGEEGDRREREFALSLIFNWTVSFSFFYSTAQIRGVSSFLVLSFVNFIFFCFSSIVFFMSIQEEVKVPRRVFFPCFFHSVLFFLQTRVHCFKRLSLSFTLSFPFSSPPSLASLRHFEARARAGHAKGRRGGSGKKEKGKTKRERKESWPIEPSAIRSFFLSLFLDPSDVEKDASFVSLRLSQEGESTGEYVWSLKAGQKWLVTKENDHAFL